jgi:cytochrome c556
MLRRASLCAVTALFALIATGTLSAQYDLVKVVTDRKGVMLDIQSAYWPLLEVKNGKSTDLAAAAAASQSIEDALGRFSALLLPGTAKGELPGSRANPEVWTEPADFAAASNALQAAAAALSDAASSGDIELFKARFDTFASACVGCHELKPSGGGRFRAPK